MLVLCNPVTANETINTPLNALRFNTVEFPFKF